MRRGTSLFALISLSLACLIMIGCEQVSEEELKAAKDAEEWAWIAQAKTDLDAKREEIKALHERIASGEEPSESGEEPSEEANATDEQDADGAEGSEGEAPAAEPTLAEQAEAMQEELNTLTQSYSDRLFQFINDQQIGVDSEPTDIQRQALSFKSDEDILLAKEYIEKGGDYQRAIDIYTQSLLIDSDNEKLKAAKAEAESLRYMTEERLDQVKKGMTQEEVRALLGTPKHSNVREYDNGGVGWFYPKEEPRTASGVFFQAKNDVLEVYNTDFNAIKAPKEES
ncbi:MAG: outer membrane protein assembly factor BamE [Acidobacteriota bacterium]